MAGRRHFRLRWGSRRQRAPGLGAALERLGLKLDEAQIRDLFLGVSEQSMLGIAERALGAPLPPEFQSELANDVLADFERELKGIKGIEELIGRLDARVCVASSS